MTKDDPQVQSNGVYRKKNTFGSIDIDIISKCKSSISLEFTQPFDDAKNFVTIEQIVGGFGWFQFVVLLFSGLRESVVGYDAVVVSTITQPEQSFYCSESPAMPDWNSNNESAIEFSQCHVFDWHNSHGRQCNAWTYPESRDANLITHWDLVCHRQWYVPFMQSTYFLGLVVGNLFFGYLADKIGRWRAYLIGHILSLIFGYASIFAPTIELFILFRLITAFGIISNNIIYTIQIEIIGVDYRSYSTILNHFGWGLGMLLVPLAARSFDDFRYILAIAPTASFIMLPWALWLPESARWLTINGHDSKAREELTRAARFNGKSIDEELENKISLLSRRMLYEKQCQESETTVSNKYLLLLTNWNLTKNMLVLGLLRYLAFMFYYMLTIDFQGISMEANFIISGVGEWCGCLFGCVMLKLFPRRICVFIFMFILSLSFAIQAVADAQIFPGVDTKIVNTIINAIGTLSALMTAFVMLIVGQEVFPTIIRQTGCSIVNTVGETGSASAPFIILMNRSIGPVTASIIWCVISFICAGFSLCLTETKGIELNDLIIRKKSMAPVHDHMFESIERKSSKQSDGTKFVSSFAS
ncbi:Solute carrier family 22 member 13 [Fragariocoptes setiger]|uniref:Solute carrier family 22 member 13 n=1 Tax=Fragariocoptes setiger TaxID=1670756 RepID=A0ABQ7S6B2_9ACAR|nr:Solute carrier family 22 member 13 [Fragariocoptes setiger]